ncbi:hypothetical protein HDA32_004489 [Spinactinospora alkalitolerans]|uniref:Ferric siderophore reductase C-terminal domain-containing protein n=1 Tax=Spinactinospora alkalitolerans TaxID=687207 RepID=A0A852TZE8_9ACTN|nr:(2Fe-2S)-binding protein [Spinactinospora alkalitolerans]NYE49369.1 hypothetical protein [Spinactinospora alkalitolerans]
MPTCHPLAGVVQWVNERDLHVKVDLLGAGDSDPFGPEWVRGDRIAERVPELLAGLEEGTCRGHRTSAAAIFAADLGRQLVAFAAGTAYLTGRAPQMAARRLWVRAGEGGRLDRLALRRPDVAVLPGDPMAHRPGVTVVADENELDRWFMSSVVAALEPVVAAVRAVIRYGTRQQWSMVADGVHWALLLAAGEVGHDQRAAWLRAARMAELINSDAPRMIARQRPFPLVLPDRLPERAERVFLVRGGCCFYYRYGGVKCASCPLETDEQRERLLLQGRPTPQRA